MVKNLPATAGDFRDSQKIPWMKTGQPTLVVMPEESHGQRSLAGYGPKGCKELDTTEVTYHTCKHAYMLSLLLFLVSVP